MAGLGYKDFVNGVIADASEADGYFMQQAVMRFASLTAADTALAGVISDGMMITTDDTEMLWMRRLGVWWEVMPWTAYRATAIATPVSAAWGNLTGFTFPMQVGVYAIANRLFLNPGTGNSSLVDVRIGYSWTGTATVSAGYAGNDANLANPAYNGPWTGHAQLAQASSPLDEATDLGAVASVPLLGHSFATAVCTVAGTMQVRLRQGTSHGTNVVNIEAGSHMIAHRIA